MTVLKVWEGCEGFTHGPGLRKGRQVQVGQLPAGMHPRPSFPNCRLQPPHFSFSHFSQLAMQRPPSTPLNFTDLQFTYSPTLLNLAAF